LAPIVVAAAIVVAVTMVTGMVIMAAIAYMLVYRLEGKICQASLKPKIQTNYEIKIYEINIYIITIDTCIQTYFVPP
jgi:hypothetical protein